MSYVLLILMSCHHHARLAEILLLHHAKRLRFLEMASVAGEGIVTETRDGIERRREVGMAAETLWIWSVHVGVVGERFEADAV